MSGSTARPGAHEAHKGLDLDALLDQQKVGASQILVIGLCLVTMAVDGFDLFMISMAIPAIAAEFALEPAAIAPVIVLQNAGLAVGSYVAGPLSDRFGRKPILLLCIVGFSLLTIAATWASNLTELSLLRGATGVFLGGVVPNTIALTSETSPARHRAGFVGLMFSGYAVGGLASSFLSGILLAEYGWRAIFWTAAIAGFALLPLLWLCLPESLRYLLRSKPNDPRTLQSLRRLAPASEVASLTALLDSEAGKQAKSDAPRVMALFQGKLWPATVLLWIAFVLSIATTTSFSAWTPSVLMMVGDLPPQTVGNLMAAVGLGGLVGTMLSGFLLDRLGARTGLVLWFLAGAGGWMVLSLVDLTTALAPLAAALAGLTMIGSQVALNAYAPSVYPTHVRATGVGWAFGAGRIAAILAPLVFAGLVSTASSLAVYFFALAAPLVLVAFVVPFLTAAQSKLQASSK